MHYGILKEVWDNLQSIHEGEVKIVRKESYSLGKPTGNLASKTLNNLKEIVVYQKISVTMKQPLLYQMELLIQK